MSYQAGDLSTILRGACPDIDAGVFCGGDGGDDGPHCTTFEHEDVPRDSRANARPRAPYAWLPHSCSEWVIGGPAEARALAADLLAFAARAESE